MGLFSGNFNKPGPGISKDEPKKKGAALFFSILLREFTSLIFLNLVFLLFSLPIITIVPSFIATTKVTMKMVWDQPIFLFSEFKQAFKENLKNGIIIQLGLLAAGAVIIYAIRILIEHSDSSLISSIALSIVFASNLILLLFQVFLYPIMAVIDLPFPKQIRNSLLLGIVCFYRSFAALATSALVLGFILIFFPLTLPLVVFFLFSFISFVLSFFTWGSIEKYILKK